LGFSLGGGGMGMYGQPFGRPFGAETVSVPYTFQAGTVAPAPSTGGGMEGMSGVSASSPLMQQYFAHFNAPQFRAMVITPK
jgi:hypothetical protein